MFFLDPTTARPPSKMSRRQPPPFLRRLLLFHQQSFSSSHLIRPITPIPIAPLHPKCRSFSSAPTPVSALAQSISTHLINHSASASQSSTSHLDLKDHFSLHFSDVRFNNALVSEVLRLSSSAGRTALDFFRYLVRHRNFTANDECLSQLVAFFGRRHDFQSIKDVLVEFRRGTGLETYFEAIDRLVRAGRAAEAVQFFKDMERDYGIKKDKEKLAIVVKILCEHGFAFHAEQMVKRLAKHIFPDQEMCYDLVKGWCVNERPDQAIRLMNEMVRGGFEMQTPAYNAILDSVCKLCRKKDPLKMQPEAERVLVEMEMKGVPRDTETFRLLIVNLCKIRKTEDAIKVFGRMSEWGCSPDAEIYLALVRSLYQAARVAEGDDMVKQMLAAGFKKELDVKECFGFLKILCGIERVDHAMRVFRMLKGHGFRPGVQTYDLLIQKLSFHNQVDRANALFQEAAAQGVEVVPKAYTVDPKYLKKPKEDGVKKKKRPTLPEKVLMKRKRLRRLKLSFVKKPHKRRAY